MPHSGQYNIIVFDIKMRYFDRGLKKTQPTPPPPPPPPPKQQQQQQQQNKDVPEIDWL